uniref:Uncharacterized protein n=1 Tax=Arundo donax TaxID=35708 RepID=A0A0A9ABU8_ARUDO
MPIQQSLRNQGPSPTPAPPPLHQRTQGCCPCPLHIVGKRKSQHTHCRRIPWQRFASRNGRFFAILAPWCCLVWEFLPRG